MTVSVSRQPRRELLLQAAATLFAERGFHAVGIDEIGAAAGITGPGVYRHFASKNAILEALCDRAMTQMLDGVRATRAAHVDHGDALMALIDLHVAFAIASGALIAVWLQEARLLSDQTRQVLRRRQRAYEEPWREVVAALRPDLRPDEVTSGVRLVLTMLNSTALVAHETSAARLAVLLRNLARGALLGPPLTKVEQALDPVDLAARNV